jgi:predicted N-acyltransferase
MTDAAVTLRVHGAIADIDPADWDACAGPDNPFLCHAFLEALEASGCVRPETGWAPCHFTLEDDKGRVIGCAPAYLKGHSQGEYVFDHGWAQAYARAGGHYYPKLQICVPFTPVPGRRFLLRPGTPPETGINGLIAGITEYARREELSSTHVTFCTEEEWRHAGDVGLLQRTGEQFHFENRGYGSFEDFLADLNSRKRKDLRKERQAALANDITVEILSGGDIEERHWDAMFRFYMDTGSRKWGRPYLNRRFFSLLGERMADRVVLILARRDDRYIAGALNLRGTDTLYGRYWGCIEEHRFLHFELCYYQAIDYAIAHKLARVEAGAQGPHKLARGYLPKPTYSVHWIRDPAFRRAVENFLAQERAQVAREIEYLEEHYSPFRHEQD